MWRFTSFEAVLGPQDHNPDVTLPAHSSRAGRNAVARNARRSSRSRPAVLRGRRGCERRAEGAMWGCFRGSGRFLLLAGAARHCGRPHSRTQKLFSTSSVLSTTKDESTASTDGTTTVASKEGAAETPKQKLLKMIGNMKVEVTTKRKFQQLKEQEIKKQATNKQEGLDSEGSTFQSTAEDVQRGKPLNPELVRAASAVASSFPRSKEQAESELLAQLRRHEETTDKQRRGGTVNIRERRGTINYGVMNIAASNVHVSATG
uniref:Small ribosomal subunit protein mS31 n=1 Tax=Pavo cristatus TaxID=9049 RepID=A0A8C9L6J6_PAVCR